MTPAILEETSAEKDVFFSAKACNRHVEPIFSCGHFRDLFSNPSYETHENLCVEPIV